MTNHHQTGAASPNDAPQGEAASPSAASPDPSQERFVREAMTRLNRAKSPTEVKAAIAVIQADQMWFELEPGSELAERLDSAIAQAKEMSR